jgi:hypothetical protein
MPQSSAGLRALTRALMASSNRDRLGRIKQTSQLGTIGLKLLAGLLMDQPIPSDRRASISLKPLTAARGMAGVPVL